jgi:putative PEP-CTERM system TPR-repeat lipoprotein
MVPKLNNRGLALAFLIFTVSIDFYHAAGDTPDVSAAGKYLAQAEDLIVKGDFRAAEIVLKNAQKATPHDGGVRLALGTVELRLGDIDGAQIDLTAARQNGGDEAKIVPLLGQTYIMQGKFDELLQEFPVRDDATTDVRVETLAARANAQIGLNHLDEARASLTSAEQLEPKAPALKFALARLDLRANQFDTALKRIDEAIQIAPSAEAHYLKAQILAAKSDIPGAFAEIDAAITANPNHVGALVERAQLFIAQGQDAKADADIRAALKMAPQMVAAQYFKALLLVRAGDYAGADTVLTKYAAAYKAFPQGYLLQVTVKLALKQYEQAQTAVDAYLAAVPGDIRGRKFRADILIRKGDLPEAAEELEQLADEYPQDPQVFTMLGEAYKTSNPGRSQDAYATAAKLAPDDPSAVGGLALVDLDTGQAQRGVAGLEKLVKIAPDSKEAAESLAMAYIVQKNYPAADQLIPDLVKRNPDDPIPAHLSGLSQLAQSHMTDAKTAFQAVVQKFPNFIPSKLELAKIDEAEGARDQARHIFEDILAIDPANLPALEGLSAIVILENQSNQLSPIWKKAYQTKPDDVSIELGLINAYSVTRDIDGALSAVRDIQVRQPREPKLMRARFELQVQKKDFKGALESIKSLNELQPDNSAVLRDLALMLEKTGDHDGALSAIVAARKLDPASAILAADAAKIIGARDPDKGIAEARRFAELLPEEPTAQAVEGDYLASLNRPSDALAAYQRALRIHPSLFLCKRISETAVALGQPSEGEKALRAWVAAHPQDVPGRLELAAFLQEQKHFDDAKVQYEGLLKDVPDDPAVLNNLALIYQKDRDPRALDYARRAQLGAPDNPQIADTLGWIMALGNDADAVKLLQRAHDLAPQDLDTQYHLAYALNQVGKKADAAALLKNVLSTGAEFETKSDAQSLLSQLSKG